MASNSARPQLRASLFPVVAVNHAEFHLQGAMLNEIQDFSDDRQKSWCIHCGEWLESTKINWDHVPSKVLLNRPLPPHTPQVEVCSRCNSGFSLDEEYFAIFLSCVLSGTTDPSGQKDPKFQRALKRNPALLNRIESSRKSFTTINGESRTIWEPENDRINRIVLKNARGHAYYEFGEPMLTEPAHVWAIPLESMNEIQRNEFESVATGAWPEVGSRMMSRYLTGQDMANDWVVVQNGVYRYTVSQEGTILVRSVIRGYLATEVFWS